MAISVPVRKKLWASSGRRCAICKDDLFHKGANVNIGQECHIVSSKHGGPRHRTIPDYDSFGNLILLCANDHVLIDRNVETYSEEVLQYFKVAHEQLVQSSLSTTFNVAKEPRFLKRIFTAIQLFRELQAAEAYQVYNEYDDHEELGTKTRELLQDIIDYGEISSEFEYAPPSSILDGLSEILSEVDGLGLAVFAEKKRQSIAKETGYEGSFLVTTLAIGRDR